MQMVEGVTVVFTDMSLNDVMCLTQASIHVATYTWYNIEITDWTDFYGIIHMIENMPRYKIRRSMQCKYPYEDVLRHKSSIK